MKTITITDTPKLTKRQVGVIDLMKNNGYHCIWYAFSTGIIVSNKLTCGSNKPDSFFISDKTFNGLQRAAMVKLCEHKKVPDMDLCIVYELSENGTEINR